MTDDSAPLITVPWFQRFPRLALLVAGALFVGVFVFRLVLPGTEQGIAMLFVFPIALLALARGRTAGLAAGAVAVVLLVSWVVFGHWELTAVGWASRLLPLLLVGGLLGDASDRLARSDRQRQEFALAEQRHRQAVEINDTLVQGMASAKWLLESGNVQSGLATLDESIGTGQRLVSDLIRSSGMSLGSSSPRD